VVLTSDDIFVVDLIHRIMAMCLIDVMYD